MVAMKDDLYAPSNEQVYRLRDADFAMAGDLYDYFCEKIGVSLTFYPFAHTKIITDAHAKKLSDGAALRAQLNKAGMGPRHAYIAALDGRSLAVVIDYKHNHGIIDPTVARSIMLADDLYPVKDKLNQKGWQWGGAEVTLEPSRCLPAQLCGRLAQAFTRFARNQVQSL